MRYVEPKVESFQCHEGGSLLTCLVTVVTDAAQLTCARGGCVEILGLKLAV